MKRGLVLVTLVAAILSLPAYLVWRALPAQTAMKTQLRLIDAGSVTNSSSGFGVFMKFEPEEMPKAGLRSLEPMLLAVCNEMGPQVVALVKNKSGEAEPNKIVIVVRSGGMIGTQLKVTYDWGRRWLQIAAPNFPLALLTQPPYTALSTIPGSRESLVYFCSTGPKVTRRGPSGDRKGTGA